MIGVPTLKFHSGCSCSSSNAVNVPSIEPADPLADQCECRSCQPARDPCRPRDLITHGGSSSRVSGIALSMAAHIASAGARAWVLVALDDVAKLSG